MKGIRRGETIERRGEKEKGGGRREREGIGKRTEER